MKLNKNKVTRSDITVLPIVPGTIFLSIALIVAFLILLVALNLGGMVSLPHWIERIIGTAADEGTEDDGFSQAFLSSLTGEKHTPEDDLVYMETDSEALLQLLMSAVPTDSYYQSYTLKRTDGQGLKNTQQITRVVSGTKEYAEVISNGYLLKIITTDRDTICITERNASRHFARTEDSPFTPESELGLPSLTRMQSMIAEAETGKYALSLTAAKNNVSIRAEFTDTVSGTREVYELLPDCGLIFAAYSYLPGDDAPYYTLTTETLLSDISGFDESIFDMPIP